jgi:hypothetical protein
MIETRRAPLVIALALLATALPASLGCKPSGEGTGAAAADEAPIERRACRHVASVTADLSEADCLNEAGRLSRMCRNAEAIFACFTDLEEGDDWQLCTERCEDMTVAAQDERREGTPSPDGWRVVSEASLVPAQQQQRERAAAARQELAETLVARLLTTIQGEGAVAAIDVCRQAAPQIAAQVAETHGVAIGRTSHRLRNPANQPPDWARTQVEQRVAEPVLLSGPDGQLGVLTPIRTSAVCLQCHGAADALAPGVTEILAQHYPADRATDFEEGDLRGWFWVEVGGAP